MTDARRLSLSPQSVIAEAMDRFSSVKVLCVGDVMLDRFQYGRAERISPEAPVPVLQATSEVLMLGGAGNVVRNATAMGASVTFASVLGDDAAGKQVLQLLSEEDRVSPFILTDKGRVSTQKNRFIADGKQMLRVDYEEKHPISSSLAEQIESLVEAELEHTHILILSDYAKGVLPIPLMQRLIAAARKREVIVAIDPKLTQFSAYAGASVLTPNLRELSLAAGQECTTLAQAAPLAQHIVQQYHLQAMVVTGGAQGIMVVTADAQPVYFPALERQVFDVSGAGDTVIATLAVALGAGLGYADAAYLANLAGGIAVSRQATAVVYRRDLRLEMHGAEEGKGSRKVMPASLAATQVAHWQETGLKVGFTNGCFDGLHSGHLLSLTQARSHCDRLIVAINSDASTKRLKGQDRPINTECDRALLLAMLEIVDAVVIFGEDTPYEVIKRLQPDILMKGEDYLGKTVVGSDIVEARGGQVVLLPMKEGYSTSSTIARIRGAV